MWRIKKQESKYHNVSKEYGGKLYHSKKEATYAMELDLRVKAHDILRWERQVRVDLVVNSKHICNYIVDFLIFHHDGTQEFVEVKGFETEVWRFKWKLFEALYGDNPAYRLTVVK